MRIAPMFMRLTAIAFTLAAATAPLAAQDATDADVKAIESFRLTVPVLNKMAQVQENMYATVKAHPDLVKKYANQKDDDADEEDAKTIDQMAKRLDKVPEFKAAIIKAGFTPRSYMIATMATFQAAMTSAVLDMPGADRSKVPANAMANASFLKAHQAEFQKMQARAKEIEKLTKPESDDSDDSAESAPDTSGSRR